MSFLLFWLKYKFIENSISGSSSNSKSCKDYQRVRSTFCKCHWLLWDDICWGIKGIFESRYILARLFDRKIRGYGTCATKNTSLRCNSMTDQSGAMIFGSGNTLRFLGSNFFWKKYFPTNHKNHGKGVHLATICIYHFHHFHSKHFSQIISARTTRRYFDTTFIE